LRGGSSPRGRRPRPSGRSLGGALSVIETPRLIGRLPALENLEEFIALVNDPRVAPTLGGPYPPDELESWLRDDIAHWQLFDFGAWHAFEKSSDQLVGRIGSHTTLVEGVMEVELAWAVHADHWGQGYAAELAIPARDLVFSRGVKSVVAFTLPDNTSSRRVMEKLGMTYERDIVHADLQHVLYRSTRA
jgi:[ribosomal protein S5]-alanine N-acetyltransferase